MNAEFNKTNSVEFAKALADPTRQEIMSLICCRELSVGDIVEAVGVSQPTVSHHLAILKEAGLVTIRNEGKHAYYTLNQGRVVRCCGNLIEVFAPQTEAAEIMTDKSTMDPSSI
ncbi:MAG: winged helix-turn-helix transcriptional regulator [Chloroflexota bacterium]|nr:MAG: winged helix-turn-helix transcriptional regulator [Chloroflexota bacterium]